LTYPTVRQASQAINVPESTIYLRLKDTDFLARYNTAKTAMLEDACRFLQTKLQEATDTILTIMRDTEVAPMVRLHAARSIYEHCARMTEIADIMTRLDSLEQQAEIEKFGAIPEELCGAGRETAGLIPGVGGQESRNQVRTEPQVICRYSN